MSNETNPLALDELAAAATPPGGRRHEGQPPDAAEGSPDEVPPRRPAAGRSEDLGAVYDIPVQLSAVLGKTTMPVSQLLRLGRGAVVELDRKVGESIDILVNNRLVARGEVVILDDRLGVTMTEIIKTDM